MTIRKCPVCEGAFEAHMRQKYCNPVCADKAALDLRKKRCEEAKAKRAQAREEKKKYRANGDLSRDAQEARANDMTYGKYMAKKYKVTITRQ